MEISRKKAIDGLGGLHIAVTTAGGGSAERTISKTGPHSLDTFRASIDLNPIGTFNISRGQCLRVDAGQRFAPK